MPDQRENDLRRIRTDMRRQRRRMDASEHARALARMIASQPRLLQARSVAGYIAFDGEADPALVLRGFLGANANCYLPALRADDSLEFRPWRETTPMANNRFGIPEPADSASPADPRTLHLVLTPLVAFDAEGTRLGMGGGYYDRTFAFTLANHGPGALLLGIAYDCQRVPRLPRRSWDVPLDAVLTESGLSVFNPQRMERCSQQWQDSTG